MSYKPIADYRAWRAGRRQAFERALEAERAMYDCGDWAAMRVDASAVAPDAPGLAPDGPDAPEIGAYDDSPWPAPDYFVPLGGEVS